MMKGFNSLTIRAVLVLTMALGGGLLGAGCGTDDDGDNDAGSGGGQAGTGGSEAGTGGSEAGSGGEGEGGSGGSVAVNAEEFTICTTVGQRVTLDDGSELVCTDEFFADDVSAWVRSCDTSDDCAIATTTCFNEVTGGDIPFCLTNRCGDDSFFSDADNGEFFGVCNPVNGFVNVDNGDRAPEAELTGTCLPLGRNDDGSARGFCVGSGTIEVGGACTADEDMRFPETLCEQGALCSTSGSCFEICDAGQFGLSEEEFAACGNEAQACTLATATPPDDFAIGFCVDPEPEPEPEG